MDDVALYLPVSDMWSRFHPGGVHLFELLRDHIGEPMLGSMLDAGFSVDAVDDGVLQGDARVEGNTLVVGKARYRAVVLPGVEAMPPDTLDLFAAFARAGGVVVAARHAPTRARGFRGTGEQHARIGRATAELFAGQTGTGLLVERDADVGRHLAARVTPDVHWHGGAPAPGMRHRRVGDADAYFVANTTNRRVRTRATFRTRGAVVERWDAVDGTRATAVSQPDGERRSVDVELAPYASAFYVFDAGGRAVRRTDRAASREVCAAAGAQEVDISHGWRLDAPGAPDTALPVLTSWHEDPRLRFFSGVATYTRALDHAGAPGTCPVWLDLGDGTPMPEEPLTNGMRAWLDAPVRDAAIVEVNGARVGTLWTPPYRVDISRALRRGANAITIRVGNTALNGWAARPHPDYRLLHLRYGKRFDPQDIDKVQPQPSGLIGRVVLRTETRR